LFTIGADPEIFVKKNGKAFSAHGLVGGTKKEPLKTSCGAVQVDGMALEFNIDPIKVGDFETFNLNIVRTIQDLKDLATEKDKRVTFSKDSVQEFEPEYLEAQPEEAKELGCDPDFNAYTMEENPRPDGTRNFRTAAGHIHIGWGADIPVDNEDHMAICAGFVKALDATVGLFMTVIDKEPRRRELYGKAGAFRPKPYGVEYRTPSNAWIFSKTNRKAVHILLNLAIRMHSNGYGISAITRYIDNEAELQRVITEGDVKLATLCLDNLAYNSGSFENIWYGIKNGL
jgi:hypothetical protein